MALCAFFSLGGYSSRKSSSLASPMRKCASVSKVLSGRSLSCSASWMTRFQLPSSLDRSISASTVLTPPPPGPPDGVARPFLAAIA